MFVSRKKHDRDIRLLRKEVESLQYDIKQLKCLHLFVDYAENTERKDEGFQEWDRHSMQMVSVNRVSFETNGYRVVCRECGQHVETISAQEKAQRDYDAAREQLEKVTGGE